MLCVSVWTWEKFSRSTARTLVFTSRLSARTHSSCSWHWSWWSAAVFCTPTSSLTTFWSELIDVSFWSHHTVVWGDTYFTVCLFVCTVMDFSAAEKVSGAKLCIILWLLASMSFSHFGELWLAGSHGGRIACGIRCVRLYGGICVLQACWCSCCHLCFFTIHFTAYV